tara:strand:- start:137 stop:457 length:321 start_codon:yes stop_codon:yes gene_type:complete
MSKIELLEYEVLNDMLLLQWEDQSNSIVPLKPLRDNCPCANCSGETDVFGNLYKGPPQSMNDNSYIVSGIQPIGYYALRIFWKDGHSDGIFSFKFLKKLSEKINQS